MKILVVVGPLTGLGGIETCLRNLSEEALRNGDEIHILALCPSLKSGDWHSGLLYREIQNGSNNLKLQALTALPTLMKQVRVLRPDAVVSIYSALIPVIRLSLSLSGSRCPVLSWLHFSLALKQRTQLLRFADGHIAISRDTYQVFRAKPELARNVYHVPNGLPVEHAKPLNRSEDGTLRLLHIGRLMVGGQKRTDMLLRILSKVHGKWTLEIIGSGDDLDFLKQLAVDLKIADRLSWYGWSADAWSIPDAADFLLLTSKFEGFPMILVEAIARSLPCISTNCPSGPSEIIEKGINGYLVEIDDEEEFARRLQSIVDGSCPIPEPEQVAATALQYSSANYYLRFKKAISGTIDSLT